MFTTFPARRPRSRAARVGLAAMTVAAAAIVLSGCAAPTPTSTPSAGKYASWDDVLAAAKGETVDLWMYGGDNQGNAYIDNVLAPAVAKKGVKIKRVPVTDTADALNRVLSELQAGRKDDGTVDLIWVNGENFLTGKEANAWLCNWTKMLPNLKNTSTSDPLLVNDFATPVDGCEAPWSKAQFSFVYNSDVIKNPPTTLAGILDWAKSHPGRFTYPSPPDFTGSVFVREALYSVSGGYKNVPLKFSQADYDKLTPKLYKELAALAPSLWRGGDTYPASGDELNQLYADGQVDWTMTYGPSAVTDLVAKGTYPKGTKILTLDEGTVGNASFLGLPVNAKSSAGAMVVANEALSVDQQAAKADPSVWGQFTVTDYASLSGADKKKFDALPKSDVVPTYDALSKNANPELAAAWLPPIEEGWRTQVLGAK